MVVSILGNHLMEKLYLSTGITLHGIGQSSNVPGQLNVEENMLEDLRIADLRSNSIDELWHFVYDSSLLEILTYSFYLYIEIYFT